MNTKVSVISPSHTAAPRGANWVGLAFDALRAGIKALRATQLMQRRRIDAAWLRNYANQIQASDPGMAADLRAAADRHTG